MRHRRSRLTCRAFSCYKSAVPDYKALLADAQSRAGRLRVELAATEREIMLLEELALHGSEDRNILGNMQEQSLGIRIAAGRKKQGPSRKAQIAMGKTDQQIADMLKVPRLTVCKWHLGMTAIPAAMADKLASLKPRGIPRSSWPKIAG